MIPFRMAIQHEMVIDGLCLGGRRGGIGKFVSGDRAKTRQEGRGQQRAGETSKALSPLSTAALVSLGTWFS